MKKFILFAFLFSVLVSNNDYAQGIEEQKVTTLEIGQDIPEFSLPGVDGKTYSLNDFAGKEILVVIFTCNHCPTAQAYEERIMELYNDYNDLGVGFAAISPNSNEALSLAECGYSDLDDSFESMKIRAADKDFKFPYLYDGETSLTSMKFGPVVTPHVFIFDSERKLRYRGRIDDEESPYMVPNERNTRDAIVSLLEGRKVIVEKTKTFGCSVKWPWKDQWTKTLIEQWADAKVSLEEANADLLVQVLKNNSEKLLMINVWATYCGPCVMEFPELITIDRMYRGRKFEFVTMSMDKPTNSSNVLAFLTEQEAANRNLIWSGKNAYEAIEIIDPEWQGSLPYTMLVKPGGEILYRYAGPINPLSIKKEIIGFLGRYFADDK